MKMMLEDDRKPMSIEDVLTDEDRKKLDESREPEDDEEEHPEK